MSTQAPSDSDIDRGRPMGSEAVENALKLCLKDITLRFSDDDKPDISDRDIQLWFSSIGDSPPIVVGVELRPVGHLAWASDRFVDFPLSGLDALSCSASWPDGQPIASFRWTRASLITIAEERHDTTVEQMSLEEASSGPHKPRLLSATSHTRNGDPCPGVAEEDQSELLLYIESAAPHLFRHLPFSLPPIPPLLLSVGEQLLARYKASRSNSLFHHAIACFERVVRLTDPLDNRGEYLEYMRKAVESFLSHRPGYHKDPTGLPDIEWRVARMAQFASSFDTENGDNLPPTHFHLLGTLLFWKYCITRSPDDVSNSISAFEQEVRLRTPGDAERIKAVSHLCCSLTMRFDFGSGSVEDIHTCIKYYQDLLRDIPADQTDAQADIFAGLSSSYSYVSLSTMNPEYATLSIQCQRKAVDLTPDGHPDYKKRRAGLARGLRWRSGLLDDLKDCDEAISIYNDIIESGASAGSIEHVLHLASSLESRARLTNSHTDLSRAISLLQTTIDKTPPNSPSYDSLLLAVHGAFSARFRMTGAVGDLQAANLVLENLIMIESRDYTKADCLHTLGMGQRHVFMIKGGMENLSAAVNNLQGSVGLTPKGDFRLSTRYHELAAAFATKYGVTGDTRDIDDAIAFHQQAIALTSEKNIQLGIRLMYLASAFHERYDKLRTLEDLNTAISTCQKALDSMSQQPPNSGNQALVRGQIGRSLLSRFYATHNPEDLRTALSIGSPMVDDPTVALEERRAFAFSCALWSMWGKDEEKTMYYGAIAMDLLAQCTYLERNVHDRYLTLRTNSASGTSCAGLAFSWGRLEIGLEWLEQGRCLVWSQISQLQTPLDNLCIQRPDLADKLEKAGKFLQVRITEARRKPIDSRAMLSDTLSLDHRQVEQHMDAAREWHQTLHEIRQIEEFRDFLKPPKVAHLLGRLPAQGVIVTFSVLRYGPFALALIAGRGIIRVPLNDFSDDMASTLRDKHQAYLKKTGVLTRSAARGLAWEHEESDPRVMSSVLADLWRYVVKPVMDALEFKPMTADKPRPRIWWCPTAQLSFLPLHAAGVYGDDYGFGSCVSDYVVSSYTPSVTNLLNKLEERSKHATSTNSLLLVSQPDTPGLDPIPATTEETWAIQDILQEVKVPCVLLEREDATLAQVTSSMKSHSWVHFACHASQTEDPFASGIHLHDGRLELLRVINEQIPNTDHAFLSACQTGGGNEKLPQEDMHVAASMLAAGYRSVVATMWSICDKHGPVVAKVFYQHLVDAAAGKGGSTRLDSAQSAYALDRAVQELRAGVGDGEAGLLAWVPYAHFGV